MRALLRTAEPLFLPQIAAFWQAGVFDLVAIAWAEEGRIRASTVASRGHVLAAHRELDLPPRVVDALASPAPANGWHAVVLAPGAWVRVTAVLRAGDTRGAA
jgi:hypothetical protein